MRTPLLHLLRRTYSTAPTPLINIRSIPAPHTGRITILTLNRPASKNAISRALLHELRTHITAVQSEKNGETRALVIGSAIDGVFCAGADLKVPPPLLPPSRANYANSANLGARRVHALGHSAVPRDAAGNAARSRGTTDTHHLGHLVAGARRWARARAGDYVPHCFPACAARTAGDAVGDLTGRGRDVSAAALGWALEGDGYDPDGTPGRRD